MDLMGCTCIRGHIVSTLTLLIVEISLEFVRRVDKIREAVQPLQPVARQYNSS